jgi:hypothetical protein
MAQAADRVPPGVNRDEGRPATVQAMGQVDSGGVPTPGGIRSRAGPGRFWVLAGVGVKSAG